MILSLLILFFAVVVHEFAHGWVALQRGDETARAMGRLTLNPLAHIDPVGTILVPAFLAFVGLTPLGWAKPVPVNFARLRDPRRDMIWVALAGPGVNVLMALGFALLARLFPADGLTGLMLMGAMINLLLALFNLIPIPPLDGSRVVMGLLPLPAARSVARVEPYGFLIILVMLNFGLLEWVWHVAMLLTFAVMPEGYMVFG